MEMKFTIALNGSNGAGVPANLTLDGGRVALRDFTVIADNECAVPAAAAIGVGATDAFRPLGVIESAEDAAGGLVTIVSHGVASMLVGAAGIAAGTMDVTYDATGAAIACPAYNLAGGVSSWTVGTIIHEDLAPYAAYGAGQLIRVYVNPQRQVHA